MIAARQLFLVFVYGTLKKGEPNHHYLTNSENGFAEYMCSGKTETKFPLIVGTKYNIPFLLNVPEHGHHINGEIYSIDAKMLKKLDELEDYPEIYDRNMYKINGLDGKMHDCAIYMLKKFPDSFLTHEFLNDYKNSVEQPYSETDREAVTIDDIYNPRE